MKELANIVCRILEEKYDPTTPYPYTLTYSDINLIRVTIESYEPVEEDVHYDVEDRIPYPLTAEEANYEYNKSFILNKL